MGPPPQLSLHHIYCSAVSDVWQSDSLYGKVSVPELSLHHIHGSVVSDVWQSDSLYGEIAVAELSLHHIHCTAVREVWQSESLCSEVTLAELSLHLFLALLPTMSGSLTVSTALAHHNLGSHLIVCSP